MVDVVLNSETLAIFVCTARSFLDAGCRDSEGTILEVPALRKGRYGNGTLYDHCLRH
jgi:hypothetical protein